MVVAFREFLGEKPVVFGVNGVVSIHAASLDLAAYVLQGNPRRIRTLRKRQVQPG